MSSKSPLLYGLLALFLTACAGTTTQGLSPWQSPAATRLLWESESPSPKWIYDTSFIPDKKEGYEYFSGMSQKFSTEKEAREDALFNALKYAAQAIGVEVKIDRERVLSVNQKASEVMDPTIAGIEQETSFSEAFIRGSRPDRWYVKKLENYVSGKPVGIFFESHVLLKISEKHIEIAVAEDKKRKVKEIEIARVEETERRELKEEAERKERRRIKMQQRTVSDFAKELVLDLGKQLNGSTPIPLPLYFGDFTHTTGCSGSFIEGFKNLLENSIVADDNFRLKGKIQTDNAAMGTHERSDLGMHLAKKYNTPVLHGKVDDKIEQGKVLITAFISGKEERLASASIAIEKEKIKGTLVPKGCIESRETLARVGHPMQSDFLFLMKSSAKGHAVQKGETVNITAQCGKPCYLTFFNIDKSGNIALLDSQWASSPLAKEKEEEIFSFQLNETGVETIIGIASLKPLPDVKKSLKFDKEHQAYLIPPDEFPGLFKVFRLNEIPKAEERLSLTIFEPL